MSKKFDKLLEAATDSTNLEPNWDGIIACFDSIRSGEVPAKTAMQSMRKRIQHDNPHVVMHALLVLDACVKNCGHKIHAEVATREFMEEFKNLGINGQYENVKAKVLEMLQCWAMAFANKPEYKIVVDTHNLMKLAGFDFPSIKEADAMFTAQVAPDWHDGSECFRCRSEFSLFNRKHHCRACGQIFCDRCSTKEIPLPQFGIEKEVRVCDACYEKITSKTKDTKVVKNEPGASVPVTTELSQAEKEKLLKEKEEEDLALALAISQSEAEAKDQERQKSLYAIYNGDATGTSAMNDAASLSSYNPSEMGYKGAAPSVAESPTDTLAADDPLARYLNRDYWQQKKAGASAKVEEWAGVSASAPLPSDASVATSANAVASTQAEIAQLSLGQNVPMEDDIKFQTEGTLKWCAQLKSQVTVMENRIRSNTARGRSVLNDTAIQGLFSTLTEFHAQVLGALTKLDEERTFHESLQDHLGHISEARLAIDELRAEHERRRHERLAEEQRQRQAQMKQTLEMMRIKKHVMLMEQRNVALQRFQHQEMQARRGQMQPAPYYPGYSSQQPAAGQGGYAGYVMPSGGYQAFPQQQYVQSQTGYQTYPNAAVPANQWQDQATANHQVPYGNLTSHTQQHVTLTNANNQPLQHSAAPHPQQAYYPPTQPIASASYKPSPDPGNVVQSGVHVPVANNAHQTFIQQYPTAQHSEYQVQNPVNGSEPPPAHQLETVDQPLITFD
ncbi:hypothetical protein KIN20_034835 [Parelaphostrongylus tenuis]|uniref:Hepatocyte growth factor-regulated tyrosine kinase substrate n=1 Tax=Parelaphostrongylus tenuis TaxID=148309 RepID=A0AAD5WJA1_PARTN|nr:hypothetical protein KIN20_034835 [Parelaphostrongylus tenuis]